MRGVREDYANPLSKLMEVIKDLAAIFTSKPFRIKALGNGRENGVLTDSACQLARGNF